MTEGQAFCCLSFCPFFLAIVLLVLLSLFFGHCVACPSVIFFWQLRFLTFCPFSFGHCKKEQKDKQQNGQRKGTEGQATQ
jgi:hypothetical protein